MKLLKFFFLFPFFFLFVEILRRKRSQRPWIERPWAWTPEGLQILMPFTPRLSVLLEAYELAFLTLVFMPVKWCDSTRCLMCFFFLLLGDMLRHNKNFMSLLEQIERSSKELYKMRGFYWWQKVGKGNIQQSVDYFRQGHLLLWSL